MIIRFFANKQNLKQFSADNRLQPGRPRSTLTYPKCQTELLLFTGRKGKRKSIYCNLI